MKFYTHYVASEAKIPKYLRIMLFIEKALFYGLLLFCAITTSLYAHSILPGVIIILCIILMEFLNKSGEWNLDKAHIEIKDDIITDVKYICFIKIKKTFCIQDIASAKKEWLKIYYTIPIYLEYIVFKDFNGKYMFKIRSTAEAINFFGKYFTENT